MDWPRDYTSSVRDENVLKLGVDATPQQRMDMQRNAETPLKAD